MFNHSQKITLFLFALAAIPFSLLAEEMTEQYKPPQKLKGNSSIEVVKKMRSGSKKNAPSANFKVQFMPNKESAASVSGVKEKARKSEGQVSHSNFLRATPP